MTDKPRPAAGGRKIAALALPTLGVLAADPLYLLVDTAVVGHLGALPLAGLAIGGLVLSESQLTFLAYGTTARAARFFGSGDRAAAVNEGAQATWLALAIGALITIVVEAAGAPLVSVIASRRDIAQAAFVWLRIAILGAPAILVSLAGNGWMRGVQDTVRPLRFVVAGSGLSALLCPLLVYGWLGLPRLELPGSAVANLAGQWLTALLFCKALLSERISLRGDRGVIRAQVVLGRDLFVRVVAFQVCFLSAAAVAARFGTAAVAAHQVVVQLWDFLAQVLDSLAIAAQALVGAALGAGDTARAKLVAWRITAVALLAATVLALLLALAAPVVPELFTDDQSVLTMIHVPWWFLVAQLPIAGIVWGLDGVLLGAGDAKFLCNATVIGALVGFLPLIWLSLVLGWGLAGIWSGLTTFTVLRLVLVGIRTLSGRWAVTE